MSKVSKQIKWQDSLGVDIVKGDYIAYPTSKGELQLARVLELNSRSEDGWNNNHTIVPTIKVQGARKEWVSNYTACVYKKMGKPSTLYRLQNVLVIRNNLPATLLLV